MAATSYLALLCLALVGCAAALSLQKDSVHSNIIQDEDAGNGAVFVEDARLAEQEEDVFEGDMMLTDEQKTMLIQRKFWKWNEWPNAEDGNVYVDYRYADDQVSRSGMAVVFDMWESNTCISFNELSGPSGAPHLIITHSETSCRSSVGRVEGTEGQIVEVKDACVNSVGSAAHEIGHALGFLHEQSRTDREVHVSIFEENVKPDFVVNFKGYNTLDFDHIYDYNSAMHYGLKYFTKNGENTLEPKQYAAFGMVGQRKSLSFMDFKEANTRYQCIPLWEGTCGRSSDECQNGGYIGKNCNCVCPPGTKGDNCEICNENYNVASMVMYSPSGQVIRSEGSISSLGYGSMESNTQYVEVIQAPECHKVKITFQNFDIYKRNDDGVCSVSSLSIRYGNVEPAQIFCDEEIKPGDEFVSDSDIMLLEFDNNCNGCKGFQADVSFVPNDSCSAATEASTDPWFSASCSDLKQVQQ